MRQIHPTALPHIRKEYEEWAGVKEPEEVSPEEDLKNYLLARDVDHDELWDKLEHCYGYVALPRLYDQSLYGYRGTILIDGLRVHKWRHGYEQDYGYEWEYLWERIDSGFALYLLAYKLGIDGQLREKQ